MPSVDDHLSLHSLASRTAFEEHQSDQTVVNQYDVELSQPFACSRAARNNGAVGMININCVYVCALNCSVCFGQCSQAHSTDGAMITQSALPYGDHVWLLCSLHLLHVACAVHTRLVNEQQFLPVYPDALLMAST